MCAPCDNTLYVCTVCQQCESRADPGELIGELLYHIVLLSPNSCIFGFGTSKCTNSHLSFFVIGNICWSIVKTLQAVQTKLYEQILKRPSSGARDKKYGHLPPQDHTFPKWPFLADFKKG